MYSNGRVVGVLLLALQRGKLSNYHSCDSDERRHSRLQSAPCCHAGCSRGYSHSCYCGLQKHCALLGNESCQRWGGNEDTKYSGEVELPYGKTKAMAEKLVFEANGKKLSNGGKLTTCIIRANTVYGEKAMFLRDLYLFAKARNDVLNYLEPENTERNSTYVGNVAWMHVLAARHLQLRPDLLAGQVYYCYDDTPRKGFLVRHQILSSMDPSIRLGSHIPYWKMWLIIHLHRIIKVLLYPFWKPQPFLNLPLLNTIVTTFSYETDKAFRHFGYKPLFTWQESKQRTAQWLKAAAGNLSCPHLHEKEN
eukprot:XP_027301771.1 3 beta-hydroxysteroid dehydrogenase type 7 isoform X4 [Anas platyrhynchos]